MSPELSGMPYLYLQAQVIARQASRVAKLLRAAALAA